MDEFGVSSIPSLGMSRSQSEKGGAPTFCCISPEVKQTMKGNYDEQPQ